MKCNEFLAICGEFLIDPAIALESEDVQTALRNGASTDELREVLKENF